MKPGSILRLLCPAVAFAHAQSVVELTPRWTSRPDLPSVESVRHSPREHLLYVSNMGPSKSPRDKDGDGSIGRLGLDGTVLQADWIKGLNAPKGLGLRGESLYVADIDQVVVIDTAKGVVRQTIAVPGAIGLNDLTIDAGGVVYVTDFPAGKVFAVRDGVAAVHCDQIEKPNGILAFGPDLLVLAQGNVHRIHPDGSVTVVATGLDPSVDGIEHVRGDDFLVTCSRGIICAVNLATGASRTLIDSRAQGVQTADLAYDAATGTAYVPTLFTHQVIAYDVKFLSPAP
jgi:DNA-binding beta-propeller fold protein YncE